jgi:uncharacterized damage-inducible protein DinB
MLLKHYEAMARYNHWMNAKLYGICGELSDEERKRDMGAFFGSIHRTLNHILLADHAWMRRFTADSEAFWLRDADGEPIEIRSLDQEIYSDFGILRSVRRKTDGQIQVWAEGLTESDLAAPIRYKTSTGEGHEHPTWWAVSHFFNHQTHHRGHAAHRSARLIVTDELGVKAPRVGALVASDVRGPCASQEGQRRDSDHAGRHSP